MPQETNNAVSRIYPILEAASEQPKTRQAVTIWAQVLGVTNASTLDGVYDTVHLMRLLANEIRLAKSQMESTGMLTEDLYAFAFDSAYETIDILNLGSPWANYISRLSHRVLTALKMCVQLTSASIHEEEVPFSELNDLLDDLDELKASVEQRSLSSDLKSFIFSQIAIIERTILEVRIVGVEAFGRGIGEFAAGIAGNQQLVKQNADEPEVTSLKKSWDKFLAIAAQFITLGRAVETGRKMAEIGGDVADKIS